MNDELKAKLHPTRFPHMSPMMVAIVGFLLDEHYTDPYILDMITTNDGFVLAQNNGDVGFNAFIGSYDELRHNWEMLLEMAGLTDAEMEWCKGRLHTKLETTA
jgi:hypothetical protein